jgi:DNA-binding response OmpR family regulator
MIIFRAFEVALKRKRRSGADRIRDPKIDLVILDIMLPVWLAGSVRQIRSNSTVPSSCSAKEMAIN